MYGNYDKLNKPPVFDIHLGVNYWDTFNITTADDVYSTEIIVLATADYLQVCLINKNQGTPFISWLELRPLKNTYDQYVDSTRSLFFFQRVNLGGSNYPKLR